MMIKRSLRLTSLGQTKRLGQTLANNLVGGQLIELISDLGGGKTTLSRFIVEALGSQDHPSSPSFTIENIYRCPNFNLHHFDFYRLDDPGIMAQELAEVLSDQQAVVIIEWAEIVADILPPERLSIAIEMKPKGRVFHLKAPASLEPLLKGID